jgi:hypothetical protein
LKLNTWWIQNKKKKVSGSTYARPHVRKENDNQILVY